MPIFFNETSQENIPIKRVGPKRRGGQDAVIYISEYDTLLSQIKLFKWDDEDEVETRAVRIVLAMGYEVRVAKEGPVTSDTPAHGDDKLGGDECIFPGNEFFNADNEICMISNKSGDYLPRFNAMQYLLIAQLYEGNVNFADEITLRKYNGTKQVEEIKISRADLIQELQQLDFYRNYPTLKTSENVSPNVSPSKKKETTLSDSPQSLFRTPPSDKPGAKRKRVSYAAAKQDTSPLSAKKLSWSGGSGSPQQGVRKRVAQQIIFSEAMMNALIPPEIKNDSPSPKAKL